AFFTARHRGHLIGVVFPRGFRSGSESGAIGRTVGGSRYLSHLRAPGSKPNFNFLRNPSLDRTRFRMIASAARNSGRTPLFKGPALAWVWLALVMPGCVPGGIISVP